MGNMFCMNYLEKFDTRSMVPTTKEINQCLFQVFDLWLYKSETLFVFTIYIIFINIIFEAINIVVFNVHIVTIQSIH